MTQARFPNNRIILAAGDIAAALLALVAALLIRHGGAPEPNIVALYRFAAPFLVALWLTGFTIFGLYELRRAKNEPRFYERLTQAVLFNAAVTILLFYLIPEFRLRPMVTLAIIFAVLWVAVALWRALWNALAARRSRERILFIGITPEVLAVGGFLLANPQLGFLPAAYCAVGDAAAAPRGADLPMYRFPMDIAVIAREHDIDIIILSEDARQNHAIAEALFAVAPLELAVVAFNRFYEEVERKVPVGLINEAWFAENLIGSRRPRYEFAKRILDLTMAILLGFVALVLFPFIAIAIILAMLKDIRSWRTRRARPGDGIIFFRQPRIGKGGVRFNFIKFRSQVLGAERMAGEKEFSGADPRAYRVGTFLRKSYLDELPQLWNVVRGEMSFVGPRPERPEFVAELERSLPFYRMRELVLPGITGWAQINMANDASVSDAPEKLQYDLYYIKNRSLFLDLSIMLKTALHLLQRSGR